MRMEKKIEKAMETLRSDYQESLESYDPRKGKNGITERNLTFQFVKAFLQQNDKAHSFMEVPFKPRNQKYKHFDAIIFDPVSLIIIESKRLFQIDKARDIHNDVDRIERGI